MATFFATYDFLLVSMVLAAVLALTLYLPLMAGQLSVASPGFYALGGYIAAILSTKVFHPAPGLYPVGLVLVEMLVAAVVSGVLGVAVGLPALRLRGIFLALATIAFVQILGVVALNLDVTGGAIGIFGIPQPFASQLQYMWLAIPLLLLSGILLPMSIAPTWLQDVSDVNPIKHVVDGVRSFFLGDIASSDSLWGLAFALALVAVGVAFGARTFRRESA